MSDPKTPGNVNLTTGESELIPSGNRTKLIISNIGAADAWLSFFHTAVSRAGIPLLAGKVLILDAYSREINDAVRIYADGDTEICFQEL